MSDKLVSPAEVINATSELFNRTKVKSIKLFRAKFLDPTDPNRLFGVRLPKDNQQIAPVPFDIDDLDLEVGHMAASSLSRLRSRAATRELVDRLLATTDHSLRWLYLDNLLESSEPGDKFNDWPLEGPEIWEALSPLQSARAQSRLERRRKTLVGQQEFSDRSRDD